MDRPQPQRQLPQPTEPSWWDVRRQPLIFVLTAVIIGAVTARHCAVSWWLWLSVAIAALTVWSCAQRRCALVAVLALWALLCAGGGCWAHVRWRMFRADELGLRAHRHPQPVCVLAIARSAPRRLAMQDAWAPQLGTTWRMRVRVVGVRHGRDWQPASGCGPLLIRGDTVPTWLPGDRLLIRGVLQAPATPLNPGEYSRARWLRSYRELFTLEAATPASVLCLRRGDWFLPRRCLERLRLHAQQLLQRYVSGGHAGVAIALLLGAREQLDRQSTIPFIQTGTIHLLAISGLHLGMLVGVVWLAARLGLVRRRVALLLAAAFVIPYAVLTGAQPPVVRAAALAVCISLGRWLGRPLLNWNLLAASALGVFLLNPQALFQTGAQLSFLAVATLAVVARALQPSLSMRDPLRRLIETSRPAWNRRSRSLLRMMWQIWLTGMAVWLVALPLVLYRFHLLSPLAVFLNPLLWLPVAGALLSGFIVMLCGDLLPPLASVAGMICGHCLSFVQLGTQWGVEQVYGYRWLPAPAAWWVTAWYAGCALLAATPRLRPGFVKLMLLATLWLLVGAAEFVHRQSVLRSERGLRVTFFAVGHGTCVLLEGPHGHAQLYDAGRMGPPGPIADVVANYLWSRGHTTLNAAVISHADADHFNALPALRERFFIKEAFVPDHLLQHSSVLVTALRTRLHTAGTVLRVTAVGDRLHVLPGVSLIALHPRPRSSDGSDNANSIVLQVDFAGRRLLLPGDLEAPGLQFLLAQPGRSCDVLMAPHHGSLHTDPQAMAAWCRPRWVVVSNHQPAAEPLRAAYEGQGAVVLDTATHGAVTVGIEADGRLWIRCWRADE